MVGDVIQMPNGEYTVEGYDHGRWWVKDSPNEPVYQFTVPPGCVMYYIETTSAFLKLDVRPGNMEVRFIA